MVELNLIYKVQISAINLTKAQVQTMSLKSNRFYSTQKLYNAALFEMCHELGVYTFNGKYSNRMKS